MKDQLKIKIESFSEFLPNWGGDSEEEITVKSIETAHKFLDFIPDETISFIQIFPMRDGGIQFDIGEYREVEIFDRQVKDILYGNNYTIIRLTEYCL